jgi:hypothetical protein
MQEICVKEEEFTSESSETQEVPQKKKRGRKPNPNKKNYYFSTREENAVVEYLNSDTDEERNKIFDKILKPAFTKMIESIIRRYNLYPPNEEFNETFDDTISFLMTKLSCFDPSTNYKAYSYCGTICKNYLIYKINQFVKNQKRNISYDNPVDTLQDTLSDSVRYSYNNDDSKRAFIEELIGNTVENIKKILKDKEKFRITENEERVGQALVNLMTNWDELFAQMGSNKFNKSSILLFLKETTLLNTKEIRDAMKQYRSMYYIIKDTMINE